VKASDFRPLLGKRIKAWSRRDVNDYNWDWLRERPTWTGIVGSVKGRNVEVSGEWLWAPDISKIEVIE
jgi:hypothetical protein